MKKVWIFILLAALLAATGGCASDPAEPPQSDEVVTLPSEEVTTLPSNETTAEQEVTPEQEDTAASEDMYSGEIKLENITADSNQEVYTITGKAATLVNEDTPSGAPEYEYGETVSVTLPAGSMIRSDHVGNESVTIESIYDDYQKDNGDLKVYNFIYNTVEGTLGNMSN